MGKQQARQRQQSKQRDQHQVRAQRREVRQQTKATTARRHTGWAGLRRTRGQKLGITAVAVVAAALIWVFVDWPLAIGLTALLLLALPAVVVLTMGRRY